ncbi:hypothetical protein O181_013225 [Austropuccinia psidii MF-1]|uniref:Integrase catalytic domain-containing protein n=1 Tax=Austropuccinia psidii MF-1 TaxID=1389203 RepID=A0A9Q3BYL6_9BASI|nr:hypothetical protein [Austropuccinia psidii MF-1]
MITEPEKALSSDSDVFVVQENAVFSIDKGNKIYLDSGAGKSVVNKLNLLTNITPVQQKINNYGNSVSEKNYIVNTEVKDWHTTLGHPSDSYLKHLFNKGKIKGECQQTKDCQIFLKAKIQNLPHNRALPSSTTAFHRLHTNTLEVTPATAQGIKYVLVIMDDYSRYNCIYMMTRKSQAQGNIMAFVNEIYNKGISLERGPANSPQTNGVAEIFNQTLLTKIRCLLAQSRIPICMWNEAAIHSSLLLNLLPHKAIRMNSPYDVLSRNNMTLEEPIKLEKLMPFGLKTTVHVRKSLSKLALRGETLRALTFEKSSDSMRFYDENSDNVQVTCDFSSPSIPVDRTMRQDVVSLPLPVIK